MKLFGRDCNLQNVAFVVAQTGYARTVAKVAYTCKEVNDDAQLMPILIKKIRYHDRFHMLHRATQIGNLGRVAHMVKHGADVNGQIAIYKWTPLDVAAMQDGETAFEIVRFLVQCGANPNVSRCGFGGFTTSPLTYACENRNVELVRFLVKQGLNVNVVTDFYGNTGLLLKLVKDKMTRIEIDNLGIPRSVEDKEFRAIYDILAAHGAKESWW